MSSELARLIEEAAPEPQSPLDPDALWSAGRVRHRRRRRTFVLAAAAFVVVLGGGAVLTLAGEGETGHVTTLEDTVPDDTQADGRRPRNVEELAAADPMDLIVVFGDGVSWHPPLGAEAGVPVTEENAAAAYGPLPLALEDLATLRDIGWISGATQEWRNMLAGVDTGWSSIRVTVSRFESLAAVGDTALWGESGPDDFTPGDAAGEPPPAGVDYVCRGDRDASMQYYPGAFYGECNITVGDTIWISISSVHPGSNSEGVYELLGFWLDTVAQSLE